MPIYEFKCEECGYQLDIHKPVKDRDDLVECPHCGHGQMKRLMSAPAIQLRGIGLYKPPPTPNDPVSRAQEDYKFPTPKEERS